MFFLTQLLTHWKLALSGVLLATVVASGIYVKILKAKLEIRDSEIAALTLKLETSETKIKMLSDRINFQNEAIENLAKEAKERLKRHGVELNRANTNANNYKKQAEELMNRKPDATVPICKSADNLINEELKRVRK